MRKLITFTVMMLGAAALLFAACKATDNAGGIGDATARAEIASNQNTNVTATEATSTQEPSSSDGARRITVAELQKALEKGEAVVVDVRGKAGFDAGHIKGSRHIPADEIEKHVDKLPKDKLIVTYCA